VWNGMIQAMDDTNVRIMGFRGITPEVWAAQQQKKEEEERDASRNKVLEWMNMSQTQITRLVSREPTRRSELLASEPRATRRSLS
jgi:hypothetical protein